MGLLKPQHFNATTIEEGDAGVILKLDGTMRVFTSKVGDAPTDEQKLQGEKLLILAHVLLDPAAYALMLDKIIEMQEQDGESGDLSKPN